MGVYIATASQNSAELLLKDLNRDVLAGLIPAWSIDALGDFTHNSEKFGGKAFFRPAIRGSYIEMGLTWSTNPKKSADATEIFAFYHGQMVEAILAYYGKRILYLQPHPETITSGDASIQGILKKGFAGHV